MDTKPTAWKKLGSGDFKQADQIMYDAKMSAFFRSVLSEHSGHVLSIFEEMKGSLQLLSLVKNSIFEKLKRLSIPYKKILRNEEFEKVILVIRILSIFREIVIIIRMQ